MILVMACAHTETKMWDPSASFGQRIETQTAHYLWGLTEATVVVPCAKGVARLEVSCTSAQFFLSVFTLGIYSPRTHIVTCKG